nr:hypothetical protein CFP56_64552 [Quercus suber]
METSKPSPRQKRVKNCSYKRHSGTHAVLKPATVSKEETRGWCRSRPLSAEQRTELNVTMWKRASLSSSSGEDNSVSDLQTRRSNHRNALTPFVLKHCQSAGKS